MSDQEQERAGPAGAYSMIIGGAVTLVVSAGALIANDFIWAGVLLVLGAGVLYVGVEYYIRVARHMRADSSQPDRIDGRDS
jgi:NADH:ubiquinone oxidoreductase subunit 2 (subunit N)